MASPFLRADLVNEEGDVLQAYPDPLTHGAPWTDGVGHTGGVHEGDVITEATAQAQLTADIAQVEAGLNRSLPWWKPLDGTPRGDVLEDMAFNMGLSKLLGFNTFLRLVRIGDFEGAADDMLNRTAWARELPRRAKRLAAQMRTGIHQP